VMKLMPVDRGLRHEDRLHPEDRDMSVVEETFQSLVSAHAEQPRTGGAELLSTLQALVTARTSATTRRPAHSMRVTATAWPSAAHPAEAPRP